MHAAGLTQVCAGHPTGCEAAIHALRTYTGFEALDTDAVLLNNADNAFNRLNSAVALHNIWYTCPPLATIAINSCRSPSCLFVLGGMKILPEEGTTQGCPLSIALIVCTQCRTSDQQMSQYSNNGLHCCHTN